MFIASLVLLFFFIGAEKYENKLYSILSIGFYLQQCVEQVAQWEVYIAYAFELTLFGGKNEIYILSVHMFIVLILRFLPGT